MRLGGFGGRQEFAKAGSSFVWGGFGAMFARFFDVLSKFEAESENY